MAYQVSQLLNFVVDVFDRMPLVNTIIFKDDDVVDVEKENVYPLVTIQLLGYPSPEWDNKKINLGFEIHNQRDDKKIATQSKLMSDANYIDNIGICDTIANNFVMEIMKVHNDFYISFTDDGISSFETIRKDERNCLDGIKFQATFFMPQNGI
jgi:hypothetical protein